MKNFNPEYERFEHACLVLVSDEARLFVGDLSGLECVTQWTLHSTQAILRQQSYQLLRATPLPLLQSLKRIAIDIQSDARYGRLPLVLTGESSLLQLMLRFCDKVRTPIVLNNYLTDGGVRDLLRATMEKRGLIMQQHSQEFRFKLSPLLKSGKVVSQLAKVWPLLERGQVVRLFVSPSMNTADLSALLKLADQQEVHVSYLPAEFFSLNEKCLAWVRGECNGTVALSNIYSTAG